jgi:hypothetical protein
MSDCAKSWRPAKILPAALIISDLFARGREGRQVDSKVSLFVVIMDGIIKLFSECQIILLSPNVLVKNEKFIEWYSSLEESKNLSKRK